MSNRLIRYSLMILTGLLLNSYNCTLALAENAPVKVIQTLLLEARGEPNPLTAMQAVAEVIRHRAQQSGQSVEHVVLQRRQFSCWNNKAEAASRLAKFSGDDWQMASHAWELSRTSNITRYATNYINPKQCTKPDWAVSWKETVTIGHHVFYRLDKPRHSFWYQDKG